MKNKLEPMDLKLQALLTVVAVLGLFGVVWFACYLQSRPDLFEAFSRKYGLWIVIVCASIPLVRRAKHSREAADKTSDPRSSQDS
jgi:predicted aspartyl protease